MTPLQLIQYYANLLILQYLQKPKAYATVQATVTPALLPQTTIQSISFSGTAASGTFVLNYTPNGINQTTYSTAAINWNDSVSTIQTKLSALTGLGSVTVSGSIAAGLSVTFTGVAPVAPLLVISSNSLETSGSAAITLSAAQTDTILPTAVVNAFNIDSTLGPTAVGAQLDIIGKYQGVTRNVSLTSGVITLNDTEFLTLIKFAIARNTAGSSLYQIQALLNQFFPNEILVFDYANMRMSYLVNSSIGDQNLIKAVIVEGLLMRPMAVQLASTIYVPVITMFFGMRTYLLPGFNNEPFNNYGSYQTNWPWLSYANAIST